jgi:hypothetical protein
MSYSQKIYIGPYLVGKAKDAGFNPWDAFEDDRVFDEELIFVNSEDFDSGMHYFCPHDITKSYSIPLDFKEVDLGWGNKEDQFYAAKDTSRSVHILAPHYETLEWKYGVLFAWS